jgi:hypothetical protein
MAVVQGRSLYIVPEFAQGLQVDRTNLSDLASQLEGDF